MNQELIDEINYEIQLLIKSGFYSDDEILEIIDDEFIEENISEDLIEKLFLENKQGIGELKEDSEDFTNLKNVFYDLTKENIISIHNAGYDIEEGIQPLTREKKQREDIDIQVVDNIANEIVEFKVGFQYGNPITFNEEEFLQLFDQEHPKTPEPDEVKLDEDNDFDLEEEALPNEGEDEEGEEDDEKKQNSGEGTGGDEDE